MLKNQKFGVEIEMTGITREEASLVIAEYFRTESYYIGTYYKTYGAKDTKGRVWKATYDSSITAQKKVQGRIQAADDTYKCEIVTPILTYDDIPDLQEIIRQLRQRKALVNEQCGIHIHVDGFNHTPQSLRRLVNFITARQDLIYEALNIGDRQDHWCKKINSELLLQMKSSKNLSKEHLEEIWYSPSNDGYDLGVSHNHYNPTRYHGVNLHSYFSKGTIEFRLFNSTLHAGKIKAYIQFCLAMSAWAIESNDHIAFRSVADYTADQKVTIMRSILKNRLGLCGPEFKTCRLHLMAILKEKAAAMHAAA